MKNITNKIDNDATANGRLPAAEYNDTKNELQTLVTSSGQTLTPNAGDSHVQISQSVANYVSSSGCFDDDGVANAIKLKVIGAFKAPTAIVNSMKINVVPAYDSSGATTVDFFGVSTDKIVDINDNDNIPSGYIKGGQLLELYWDENMQTPDGAWVIKPPILQNASIEGKHLNYPSVQKNFKMGLDWQTGLIVSCNNIGNTTAVTEITVTAGSVMNHDNTVRITLPSALTKLDDVAWAEGAGEGCKAEGLTIGAGEWSQLYLVTTPTGSKTDYVRASSMAQALADTNVIAAGYTIARGFFGAMYTNSLSNLMKMLCVNEVAKEYRWVAPNRGAELSTSVSLTESAGLHYRNANLFAPLNMPATISVLVSTNDSVGSSVYAYEEVCGDMDIALDKYADCYTVSSVPRSNFSKTINVGTNRRCRIGTLLGSIDTVGYIVLTKGFYNDLTKVIQ